ncbi:unnamed protein product [Gongylonema pulchrum]|uniref:Uncharacterized protein n=1 Tax=Gongylonema pulchrum TaxID=637853 RepID=A0A183CZY3_9BILA|nr:unnamed protein product [Gongylonema pulchrum]
MKNFGYRNWEFDWSYGIAWGATLFTFGASLLLICDKEHEEVYFKEKTIYNPPPELNFKLWFIRRTKWAAGHKLLSGRSKASLSNRRIRRTQSGMLFQYRAVRKSGDARRFLCQYAVDHSTSGWRHDETATGFIRPIALRCFDYL